MLKELDHGWTQGEYILYHDKGKVSPGAVTHRFELTNRDNGTLVGQVKWMPNWRKYCWYTCALDLIMDNKCLREVAEFCDQKTKERIAERQ